MLQLTERRRAMLRAMGVTLPPLRPSGPVALAAPQAQAAVASPLRQPAATAVAANPAPAAREVRPEVPAAPVALPPTDRPTTAQTEGVASSAPEWLLVGEVLAAGANSDEARLLEGMLRAVGLSSAVEAPRRALYIGVGSGTQLQLGEAQPAAGTRPPALLAAENASARVVLVFGRAAAEAVLGSEQPLGGLRGRVHDCDGRAVVVTFSLAYLLRHPAEKAKSWADLCLAVQASTAAGAPAGGGAAAADPPASA